ncbi:peptidoglycan amidohydrolase family protein, partial [Enterococcus faecalis]|uniref:peptidoglycan amidohydrolase family protein n=1 Tax=Enterococcus faecalis TaxID=1351 RepID=UPI00359C5294
LGSFLLLLIQEIDSLFGQLERVGWSQLPLINGNYATQRGDIFIWGIRGNSGGEFGHTGIFIDENMIIHCNASTKRWYHNK